MPRLIRVVCQLLVFACLALWGAACHAQSQRLYQVSGNLFSLTAPKAQGDFRYGPFDGLSRDARFQRLTQRYLERLRQKHVPGGALAIVIDGHLAYSAGVGVLRAGTTRPVRAESLFLSASLSKMLVAATVLSLVERDGLVLERPLKETLPYFTRGPGFDASQVTLERLLNHTAGVPDSTDTRPLALRPLIEAHAQDPLWSPPGRLYNYSNSGYALLAAAIEGRTQRPFEEQVAQRVFRPSGMLTATYFVSEPNLALSAGHAADGHVIWSRPRDSAAARAAGGVMASVLDYAHFAETLLAGGGSMLSAESVKQMMTGRAEIQDQPLRRYGFGLFETSQNGLHLIEHGGAAAGFSTLVRLVPDRGFAVVAFDNGTFPPDDVADAALSAFLEVPEAPRARVNTAPDTWLRYVGTYDDNTGSLGTFEVSLREGQLWFKPLTGQRGVVPSALRGTFESDANGDIEYFVSRSGVARKRR